MSKNIELQKTVYDKNQYEQLFDTEFSSMGTDDFSLEEPEEEVDVEDFFELYNELFYDIPEEGDVNSHQFLIEKSSEYINFEPNQDEIEALQREIGELRIELLNEQQKNIELISGVSSSIPTISAGGNTAGPSSGNPY